MADVKLTELTDDDKDWALAILIKFSIPEPNSGCWLWLAHTLKGYGRVLRRNRMWLAHRLSWSVHRGPIPDGLWVLHKCDVRECVNPDHLFLGTRQDNVDDMMMKGRHSPGLWENRHRGERHTNAKLTETAVHQIRRSRESQRLLSAKYGVSQSLISMVRTGIRWRATT